MKPPGRDLTSRIFGRLTVVSFYRVTSYGHSRWKCRCSCGKNAIIYESNLLSGNTQSCGCLRRETLSKIHKGNTTNVIHGHARTGEYRSWRAMWLRCTNPKILSWKYYGGRGITVCDRWKSFENFLADMGERPKGKTLDRYPNRNGNYEPSNCRWATWHEQALNRSPRTHSSPTAPETASTHP